MRSEVCTTCMQTAPSLGRENTACGRVSTHLQAPRHCQPPSQLDPTRATIHLAVSAHKARQQSEMATGVWRRESSSMQVRTSHRMPHLTSTHSASCPRGSHSCEAQLISLRRGAQHAKNVYPAVQHISHFPPSWVAEASRMIAGWIGPCHEGTLRRTQSRHTSYASTRANGKRCCKTGVDGPTLGE